MWIRPCEKHDKNHVYTYITAWEIFIKKTFVKNLQWLSKLSAVHERRHLKIFANAKNHKIAR